MHFAGLNCAEFKLRLDAVLDSRTSPDRDSQLRAHARRCSKCAQSMADHVALLEIVDDFPPPSPPADFSLRVLQTVQTQRERQRQRAWSVALLAVAAGLLIAVVSWRIPGPVQQAENPPAMDQPPTLATIVDFAEKLRTKPTRLAGEVAQGFKPVTSSVYTALHTLWRSLPGSESAQKVL